MKHESTDIGCMKALFISRWMRQYRKDLRAGQYRAAGFALGLAVMHAHDLVDNFGAETETVRDVLAFELPKRAKKAAAAS